MNNINDVKNANDAYYMAHRFYDADNRKLPEQYNYLAEVILNDSTLKDPGILVWWARCVKTHVDEMFNKLLDFYDVYAFADWHMEVDYYRNSELKLQVIKNDDVNEWLNHINKHYFDRRYFYTRNDFYNDLPQEYKLGIII